MNTPFTSNGGIDVLSFALPGAALIASFLLRELGALTSVQRKQHYNQHRTDLDPPYQARRTGTGILWMFAASVTAAYMYCYRPVLWQEQSTVAWAAVLLALASPMVWAVSEAAFLCQVPGQQGIPAFGYFVSTALSAGCLVLWVLQKAWMPVGLFVLVPVSSGMLGVLMTPFSKAWMVSAMLVGMSIMGFLMGLRHVTPISFLFYFMVSAYGLWQAWQIIVHTPTAAPLSTTAAATKKAE